MLKTPSGGIYLPYGRRKLTRENEKKQRASPYTPKKTHDIKGTFALKRKYPDADANRNPPTILQTGFLHLYIRTGSHNTAPVHSIKPINIETSICLPLNK
jgi:hypothetical protein